MKLVKLITLLSIGLLLGFSQFSYAVAPNKALIEKEAVANEDVKSSEALTKKELRKQKRVAKKQNRFKKWTAKLKKKLAAVDLNDPVKKWMWFWIFGWGAALILSILAVSIASGGIAGGGILSLVSGIAGLFGTISLIIWLVKLLG